MQATIRFYVWVRACTTLQAFMLNGVKLKVLCFSMLSKLNPNSPSFFLSAIDNNKVSTCIIFLLHFTFHRKSYSQAVTEYYVCDIISFWNFITYIWFFLRQLERIVRMWILWAILNICIHGELINSSYSWGHIIVMDYIVGDTCNHNLFVDPP